jgi:hypothetical protein
VTLKLRGKIRICQGQKRKKKAQKAYLGKYSPRIKSKVAGETEGDTAI